VESKPSLDKVASKVAGLGIPGLVLLTTMALTGWAGAAAITTALAALGGPLGMLGGIALLGVLILVSKGLTEYGFEAVFKATADELVKNGHTKEEIKEKVNSYPISKGLKLKIGAYLDEKEE